MFFGKIVDVGTPCSNRADFRLKAINAPLRVHMQLGDKPASDKAYAHFRHSVSLTQRGFPV